MARTIESPGVEINEIDLSNITQLPVGTNIFIQGFAAQGPTQELVNITSVSEYERIYGFPTNAAERYAYTSIRQVLNSPGNLIFNRLPYGSDAGAGTANDYSVLAFPYVVVPTAAADWKETGETYFQTLTITASGADTSSAVITIDGTEYTYPIAGLTIEANQTELFASLSAESAVTSLFAVTSASSTTIQLSSIGDDPLPTGVFSLSSNGTLAGQFADSGTALDNYEVAFTQVDEWQGLVVGAPTLVTLNTSAYDALQQGDISTATGTTTYWATGFDSQTNAGVSGRTGLQNGVFIVSNNIKSSTEKDFSGYYLAATDNTNITDQTYSKINYIETQNNNGAYTLASANQDNDTISFNLTSSGSVFSTSEIVETSLGFNFGQSSYNDMVQFTLMRLRPNYLDSTSVSTKVLDQSLVATIPGSLDATRVGTELTPFNPQPTTTFIDNTVDRYGQGYISVQTNPLISTNIAGKVVRFVGSSITTNAQLSSEYGFDLSGLTSNQLDTVRTEITNMSNTDKLFAMGPYKPCNDADNKIIGKTISKLDRGFRLAQNRDLIPLDIVVDAGLSTIEAVSNYIQEPAGAGSEHLGGKDIFDDTITVNLDLLKDANQSTATTDPSYQRWQAVFSEFNTFCKETRKDCMFIMDPLRHIFVQGKDTKVINKADASFSQDILVPLRNLVNNTNSNYAAVYGNWVKNYDAQSDSFNWAPFSAFEAAIMARLDANFQPWFAPAGFNNGIVRNIVDLAIVPNQKERDLLYRYSINPVTNFPRDGFVVMGQKTLQAKPSALDRINVRRLFLVLEKATRQVARYFVFEPNTIFTRTRLVNVLKPIFENAKSNQGVYDYLIVCDERNNTPDVIDRNELVVDIYIKPVRAAEFILINFIATRTGDDFSELIGT